MWELEAPQRGVMEVAWMEEETGMALRAGMQQRKMMAAESTLMRARVKTSQTARSLEKALAPELEIMEESTMQSMMNEVMTSYKLLYVKE